MRPGMQLTLWMQRAPRSHVISAGVAGLAALVILAASFVPSDSDQGGDSFESVSSAGTSADGTSSAPSEAAPIDGTVASTPTGSEGGTEEGGSTGAGPIAGPAAVDGEQDGTPGTGGPLTASDRGVTPDSIKVGVFLANVTALSGTPFVPKLRGDARQFVDALVKNQNDSGGVAGRKLMPVYQSPDATSESAQNQSCQSMVRDEKVFGIFDAGALTFASQVLCITVDNATPFVHAFSPSSAIQSRARGLDLALQPAWDRVSQDWAAAAKALGALKQGARVGILTDTCLPQNSIARNVLAPAFKAAGASAVELGEVDCSPNGAAQVSGVAVRFKLAGVQLVLPATAGLLVHAFVESANSQDYHPTYFASDWWTNAGDTNTQNFPDQWHGVMGVTSQYNSEQPANAALQACSRIAQAAKLPPITRSTENAELIGLCDSFRVFVAATAGAGADLTRPRWAAAAQRLGTMPMASTPQSTYGPGKFDGSDLVQYVKWDRACRCYHSTSGFVPSVTLR